MWPRSLRLLGHGFVSCPRFCSNVFYAFGGGGGGRDSTDTNQVVHVGTRIPWKTAVLVMAPKKSMRDSSTPTFFISAAAAFHPHNSPLPPASSTHCTSTLQSGSSTNHHYLPSWAAKKYGLKSTQLTALISSLWILLAKDRCL